MGVAIESVVSEHTVQIGYIVGTMSEIKDTLKEIVTTQRNIEVIMERQANHEENNRNEHAHIHSRIDEIRKTCEGIIKDHNDQCDVVSVKADNGDKAYRVMLFIAKSFAAIGVSLLFGIILWAIKSGATVTQ